MKIMVSVFTIWIGGVISDYEEKRKALKQSIIEFDEALKEEFKGHQVEFDININKVNVVDVTSTWVKTIITDIDIPVTLTKQEEL